MDQINDSIHGLRITTWNVNGIRNPFGYQPWREKRTFSAMFDILETDILVMQETKIQRKDLRDDMVLVPGWDVYFSLPKYKKGYSGVAIYTRNSVCAPIRAEEGITGVLTPPNSTTSFRDLPKDQQIGGYPTGAQLQDYFLDAATLDSEGRCVILEFPAFILIGVYCPATRDETRDEFRIGFLNALDTRVRNLVALGKSVFLTGDLNIIREEIDTANAEEKLKKEGLTVEQYISTPARRLFNHLLVGGKVIGDRDEGKEPQVMWDICRGFHPTRKGMFTCWDQKMNARPGNFGSRIDYVLCSEDMKDWFQDSNIQEGLMGSDHCPVFATFKPRVKSDGVEIDIRDVMSKDMFKNGVRVREWSMKDLLPTSAKLIPEFDRRQSIRDMFTRKPTNLTTATLASNLSNAGNILESAQTDGSLNISNNGSLPKASPTKTTSLTKSLTSSPVKRSSDAIQSVSQPSKRSKVDVKTNNGPSSGKGNKGQLGKGQSSLMGFFKPKTLPVAHTAHTANSPSLSTSSSSTATPAASTLSVDRECLSGCIIENDSHLKAEEDTDNGEEFEKTCKSRQDKEVHDPIVAKESWSKLLTKRIPPKCEHKEPCISHITKKQGINRGRSFYMCPRPLGPSGQQEKNTEWRCNTFIWSSEWNGKET
ncbi:Bcapn2 [Botrytis cinerea B05.10]|uniref:DNA-(apurinic or apyrimidinic site) endonuclease 2 n=1 Tax=Botryotinia fuckeliana (strain B05.10) TaxID=332648 RepID=A0A384J4I7_BOTFB|nr:Bcapn2 [Botrytis cinerea B05.10]XP_024546060.1 Bcapn2 [Botrytis cinerea B05.10]ATZ45428.1 Bcapn2 [Botrytis cinerea B05.10]ATZ45429.1 Bcapn2 [Botrytis cinerea B05.10]